MPYSLAQILAVGRVHPFYNSDIKYPPSRETVKSLAAQATEQSHKDANGALGDLWKRLLSAIQGQQGAEHSQEQDLKTFGILGKKALYALTTRLVNDTSPENSFRHCAYLSVTGGGSGSTPLPFLTDIHENRRHRAEFGHFLNSTGILNDRDWLVTTHYAGDMYRSLDLISEIAENAEASVLSAGHCMPSKDVVQHLQDYHVNVLAGESNQIVQVVYHISTLPVEQKALIVLNKIIYTSEILSQAQRTLIRSVLGDIKIFSILGSAEAGPWAIHNPDLTGANDSTHIQDFVFDSRTMKIEIFPTTLDEDSEEVPQALTEGEGMITQTSLSRLRNPLIRYNTGDIGSVHALPITARKLLAEEDWQNFRILRLRGRDRRFGFVWDTIHFEYAKTSALMEVQELGILQWQIILDRAADTKAGTLELRLLCPIRGVDYLSREEVYDRIQDYFVVHPGNEGRFKVLFVDDISQFERSTTGRKIIRFVNRMAENDSVSK